ncbi:hypothetical protein EUX98_g5596 [Antrodiella citrinella]|uniref:Uncharacterized protein n=1 Tax=Antrodiella citrinella TaxID=2447956 RepID=A0A4S4MR17_9APHY|nr:hypothetical protein EUX98_g5596 [Antrodiella citrinella]
MPSTTQISLTILHESIQPIHLSNQRYLSLSSVHLNIFRDMRHLDFANVDGFGVRGWTKASLTPPKSADIMSNPIFQITLPDSEDAEESDSRIQATSHIMMLFMGSFPCLQSLRSLGICLCFDEFKISAAEWRTLFDVLHVKAPNIKHLVIQAVVEDEYDSYEQQVAQSIMITQVIVDVLGALSHGPQPLPLLRKLYFQGMSDSTRDNTTISTAIKQCVQSRRDCKPLHIGIDDAEPQLPSTSVEAR